MPTLPKKKVGLISCSGEELPAGTLSRMATLRVLEQLRPNDTVTLCLPLFLAGDDKERAFAKFYPTVAIDGCDKRCAARATGKYSAAPAASLVVPEVLGRQGHLLSVHSRRQSEVVGEPAVQALAEEVARRVDEILGGCCAPEAWPTEGEATDTATCSCGSGVPVTRLTIAGKSVELVALPLLFEQFHREGRSPEQLMEAVKVYNAVPLDLQAAYREAVLKAYTEYCSNPGAEA